MLGLILKNSHSLAGVDYPALCDALLVAYDQSIEHPSLHLELLYDRNITHSISNYQILCTCERLCLISDNLEEIKPTTFGCSVPS
jgi:hypothetical protein